MTYSRKQGRRRRRKQRPPVRYCPHCNGPNGRGYSARAHDACVRKLKGEPSIRALRKANQERLRARDAEQDTWSQ